MSGKNIKINKEKIEKINPRIIQKQTLKQVLTFNLKEMENIAYKNAFDELVENLKELDPNAPKEIRQAFAKVYFDLEVTQEYDPRTQEYQLFYTPVWKDPSMINTDSEEFKLIEKYGWETHTEK